MKYSGSKVNVGFGLETTRGTAVSPSVWMPKTDFDYETRTERQEDTSSLGTKVDAVDSEITKLFGEGSVGGYIRANEIGILLKAFFGKDTVSELVASTVYSHLFNVEETAEAPTLTLAVDEANGDYSFPLAFVKSINISVNREEAKFSVEFISKKGDSATHTPGYVQDYKFKPSHSLFKTAANLAGLSGASGACIETFDITFTRTFEEDYCLNSGVEMNDIVTNRYAITGSLVAKYDDEASYKNPAHQDTAKAVLFEFDDADTIIGGTESPSLSIELAKVKFIDWGRDVQNDATIKQNVSFKAFYNESDGKYCDVTLVNTTASY